MAYAYLWRDFLKYIFVSVWRNVLGIPLFFSQIYSIMDY